MAYKQFLIGDLPVTIYKRKSSRSLRLSVTSQGKVQVSIPAWAPYNAGLEFAHSRQHWIRQQLPAPGGLLRDGQTVGKAHRLKFVAVRNTTQPIARVRKTYIVVHYPASLNFTDSSVQAAATKACIRALRAQAEQLLPKRLEQLAHQYDFTYGSVRVKQLKSRWGSCDDKQNIVLNLYLMQLPWDCIDYVLIHELTHTKVMQHGPRFWAAMSNTLPNTQLLRQTMRLYQPVLKTLSDPEAVSV